MAESRERPSPKDEVVRRQMQQQRRRDTEPELTLRRALHAAGLRFRVSYPVPGMRRRTIDIAFPRRRVAVFVDGCFWHGCDVHGVAPKNNAVWWKAKIDANRARDQETAEVLSSLGWLVLRLWEHQAVEEQVAAVEHALAQP